MRQLKSIVLGCFLSFSSCVFAQTYQGELEVLVFDDFNNQQSKTLYQLHEAGDIYILDLPNSVEKSKLLSGEKVTVEGQEVKGVKEKTIKVDTLTTWKR